LIENEGTRGNNLIIINKRFHLVDDQVTVADNEDDLQKLYSRLVK
jgi:hypothetical protein